MKKNAKRLQEYRAMTVRELYTYVMSAITYKGNTNKSCGAFFDPKQSTRSLRFRSLQDQSTNDANDFSSGQQHHTYRERLGGYLHPRDMRRLVTPFSNTNEPALIVRRHVMLLNFDPLRAIVLRDRLLVLVPDGADSILISLEKRMRRGIDITNEDPFEEEYTLSEEENCAHPAKKVDLNETSTEVPSDGSSRDENDQFHDEWEDIDTMNWTKMAFELVAVDCVMQCVSSMLLDDAQTLEHIVAEAIDSLQKGTTDGSSHAQDRLRILKDDVKSMESRVQGFVRALNLVLDDDEDLALMNLSRLITNPERFIQPVSEEVLHEESDEPELILEAYVQHGLSAVNALDSLSSKIRSTEDAVSMKLDSIRNRLLYINTFVSLVSASIAAASLIGSMFGMNLINHMEEDQNAFAKVVLGTTLAGFLMLFGLIFLFIRANSFPAGALMINATLSSHIRD
mmetsp:Transcript_8190/g.12139  ORF Transcript_8190/g.12139 Transcript_8190/m.12139 type:complete len:454 (+) Transcript_8190:137-1498(+)